MSSVDMPAPKWDNRPISIPNVHGGRRFVQPRQCFCAASQAAVAGKQRVKRFDNEINARLLETLFNVEPVQLLGAQRREAAAFDLQLKGFQDAAVRFEYVTGFLTSVQASAAADAGRGPVAGASGTWMRLHLRDADRQQLHDDNLRTCLRRFLSLPDIIVCIGAGCDPGRGHDGGHADGGRALGHSRRSGALISNPKTQNPGVRKTQGCAVLPVVPPTTCHDAGHLSR